MYSQCLPEKRLQMLSVLIVFSWAQILMISGYWFSYSKVLAKEPILDKNSSKRLFCENMTYTHRVEGNQLHSTFPWVEQI